MRIYINCKHLTVARNIWTHTAHNKPQKTPQKTEHNSHNTLRGEHSSVSGVTSVNREHGVERIEAEFLGEWTETRSVLFIPR